MPLAQNVIPTHRSWSYEFPRSMNALITSVVFAAQLALALLVCPSTAEAQARSTMAPPSGKSLPAIWEKAGVRERLKAERAAELDGNRLLVERIYGLQVDGDTTVHDLALKNDEVNGIVSATLIGAVTVGEPEFFDDGRVEVIRSVRIQDVVEKLKKFVKVVELPSGRTQESSHSTRTVETREQNIKVQGNAALPGSQGQARVLSKRAAEMDAYRKLAERMMGVRIDGDTTVRDLATESDEIQAALCAVLKGATPTAIEYQPDDSCEVTMQITMEDIIRTTKRHVSSSGGVHTTVKDSVENRVFSETGVGAPREDRSQGAAAAAASGSSEPFFDVKVVVKEAVNSQPVVQ